MPGHYRFHFQRRPFTILLICEGLTLKRSAIRRWVPRGPLSTSRRISSMSSSDNFAVMHRLPSCIVPCRRISSWFSRCVAHLRLLMWLLLGSPSLCATSVCSGVGGWPRKASATSLCARRRQGFPSPFRKMNALYPKGVIVPGKSFGVSRRPGTLSAFLHDLSRFLQERTSPWRLTSYPSNPAMARHSSSFMWNKEFSL